MSSISGRKLLKSPREQRRGRIRIVKQCKHLATVIDDKLEWTVNMEACYKRLYFLRKLKNFQLSNNLLYILYQSVAQRLLYNQVYSNYSNTRKADWERLDCMTTAARTIIRHDIRSPTAICEEASLYKFMTIPCDTTHPLNTALSACAHRRDSTKLFISIKARTNRFISIKARTNRFISIKAKTNRFISIKAGTNRFISIKARTNRFISTKPRTNKCKNSLLQNDNPDFQCFYQMMSHETALSAGRAQSGNDVLYVTVLAVDT